MSDRIIKVKPGYWVKVQHRTSGSPKQQEVVNVGADERIIVQRAAYAEPEPPPDPDPPPTGPVRIATAPTNGSDATAGLNADIRATPDGGTLQLVAGAGYRVDGTIGQDNRNGLTLELRGARLYQTVQRTVPLVLFEHGGNDIHVKGPGTIAGTNTSAFFSNATEHGHGIAFGGVLRASVTGCSLADLWGDGVYIDGGHLHDGSFRWSDGVDITDNHINTVGRMGVALTNGVRNVLIARNRIEQCAWYAVDLEPDGLTFAGVRAGNDHVTIDDNDFGAVGLREPAVIYPVVAFAAAGTDMPMSDFFIRNNRTVGRAFTMYSSSRTRYPRVTISGNTSDTRVSARPLQLNNIDGLTLTNNVQPMNPSGSPMLNCVNCTNVTQSGNVTT